MKLNNEVHEMKNKYYILDSHYKNANTPEFGFGDFPQTLNRTGNALTDTFPTLKEVFTSEFKTLPHTIDLSVLPYEMSKEVEKQYEGGE